uniref:TrbL/VirB6 plasmid conjugal transfer protein n=1 Tax=Cyanothece sp. (strain PCC 7425 / ATCC 29141) TaxID=395961 RepID=B8HZ23_CYAP4
MLLWSKTAGWIRHRPRRQKRLVFYLFVVLLFFAFISIPQPAEAIVFNDLAQWGREAAEKIAQNQQKIVERYFGSYNPAFAYLCYCAQGFAVFPAASGFLRWLKDDDDLNIWLGLVAPVLVLVALFNGGYLIGQIILALYKIFDGIINTFDSYTNFYALIKEGKARTLIGPSISPLFKQCEALIGAEQAVCFQNISQQALNLANEYKQDFYNASWLQDWITRLSDLAGQWLDPSANVGDKLRTTFWTFTSPIWEGILVLILLKVMEAWQALYGIAFVFAGIAAPMAVTASLFTGSQFLASAFALWLTSLFTIFLARLLLYVGYGLASDLVVSADASTDTIWFGVLMAIVIPFCVFAIARGSAAGIWASFVETSVATVSAGAMLAGGAIAGPAGAAATGAATRVTASGSRSNEVQVETRY